MGDDSVQKFKNSTTPRITVACKSSFLSSDTTSRAYSVKNCIPYLEFTTSKQHHDDNDFRRFSSFEPPKVQKPIEFDAQWQGHLLSTEVDQSPGCFYSYNGVKNTSFRQTYHTTMEIKISCEWCYSYNRVKSARTN